MAYGFFFVVLMHFDLKCLVQREFPDGCLLCLYALSLNEEKDIMAAAQELSLRMLS